MNYLATVVERYRSGGVQYVLVIPHHAVVLPPRVRVHVARWKLGRRHSQPGTVQCTPLEICPTTEPREHEMVQIVAAGFDTHPFDVVEVLGHCHEVRLSCD
jgi:hypothetical protein